MNHETRMIRQDGHLRYSPEYAEALFDAFRKDGAYE